MDQNLNYTATFCDRIDRFPRDHWNSLLDANDAPFLRHEFLLLLDRTGCTGGDTGWQACHLSIHPNDNKNSSPVAILPLYLKYHSYGEYVFDWAWARAYQQHGLRYYPKLVSSIPFTPVTTRKLLCLAGVSHTMPKTLLQTLHKFCDQNAISSIHALFLEKPDLDSFLSEGYLKRTDYQFRWHNDGYTDFGEFLSRFTSKKRKNIRSERRRVVDNRIHFRWLSPNETSESDWSFMYQMYLGTVLEHGATPYLTKDFFLELPNVLPEHVLLLMGTQSGPRICSALYFRSDTTLYGRYWGASKFVPGLHFETCYYQPIEFAIAQGLSTFEAGAQGLHKLSRGLEPTKTFSAHWLQHPQFFDAIDHRLQIEQREQDRYGQLLGQATPFRKSN